MSISAEPRNAPCSEIWITRESIVASTVPSTTSVSQSVISTPLSLMLGPTVSLLPVESPAADLGAAGAAAGCAGAELPPAAAPPRTDDEVVLWRGWNDSGSRLPKKGFCTAIRSP